jgi:UDP-glucuronate 4-epimerase
MESLFQSYQFESVIHLAAQAGVRHSLVAPMSYVHSNLIGFCILLECCRHHKFLKHLVYASTSSVYGMNTDLPFHEGLVTDTPMSLYAATKQANESLAQSYYHLYKIPMTGLRFFTVYGPWGRPDMALFKFTKAILENQPIEIFNQGQMVRDWTYVEDVAQAVLCAIEHIPNLSKTHKIYNIGRGSPESLAKAIEYLEEALSKKAEKIYLPLQKGDVVETQANIDKAKKELGYNPKTFLKEGIQNFVDWYRKFYKDESR